MGILKYYLNIAPFNLLRL